MVEQKIGEVKIPKYTFEDEEGSLFDIECSIAEYEKFKEMNPNCVQRFDRVYIGTVSKDFEWHMEHGLKHTFKALRKQWQRSASEKHQREMK